jgi:hypothetical protein
MERPVRTTSSDALVFLMEIPFRGATKIGGRRVV